MSGKTNSRRLVFLAFLSFLLYWDVEVSSLASNGTVEYLSTFPNLIGKKNLPSAASLESTPFQRALTASEDGKFCDPSAKGNPDFKRYFDGMNSIYKGDAGGTCLPAHVECGWPVVKSSGKKLPLLVLSVGLEGAGHHLWTEILKEPVFDCVWVNGRHYRRDIADGVPRLTSQELHEGIQTQFNLRVSEGMPACKKVYDAEDSFPTGAIRKTGRVFCRPDLINVQKLDGVLYDVKYLIIARNVTDTALSALRRNFFLAVDSQLRTVEHTLTYLESALKGVPCHRVFIAHYEHALSDPISFINPLSSFLELDPPAKAELTKRLTRKGKFPARKEHKLTQFDECKKAKLDKNISACYNLINSLLDRFFHERSFMWPTFAGNGFDVVPQPL